MMFFPSSVHLVGLGMNPPKSLVFLVAMFYGMILFEVFGRRLNVRTVAVGDAVAQASPRHFWVRLREHSVAVHRLRRRLGNDNEAHDDRLLGTLILKEVGFTQPLYEDARIGNF